MKTTRVVHDEELFVPYGMGFSLDFVRTMTAAAREYYSGYDGRRPYVGVPTMACPLAAAHEAAAVIEAKLEAPPRKVTRPE
eukprot:CAMPEP_0174869900 /NCGR_PEP_ID=MMETSP1114-20130205/68705_1 /TAXON_ID=312471 /ORGANISM="Neobodo designis, Strain CCAP 1951/1" /LENGTH=80 /DNA_ID=CAMNT_0016105161 /DNA_START=1 /DNA_END=240 /DNA_ORIENTATION=-